MRPDILTLEEAKAYADATKADKPFSVTSSSEALTLADNTFYNLSDVTVLTLSAPASESYICHLKITMACAGAVSLTFDGIKDFTGDDISRASNGEVWEINVLDGYAYVMNWGVPAL